MLLNKFLGKKFQSIKSTKFIIKLFMISLTLLNGIELTIFVRYNKEVDDSYSMGYK